MLKDRKKKIGRTGEKKEAEYVNNWQWGYEYPRIYENKLEGKGQ